MYREEDESCSRSTLGPIRTASENVPKKRVGRTDTLPGISRFCGTSEPELEEYEVYKEFLVGFRV